MQMFTELRNRHFLVMDVLFLPLAVYLSYVIRLEQVDLHRFNSGLLVFTLISTVVTVVIFRLLGVYSRYWLFASMDEMFLLGSSVMVATMISAGTSWVLIHEFWPSLLIPRSIPLIFYFLSLSLTALPRFTFQVLRRHYFQQPTRADGKKILIMGAGSAGVAVAQELKKNSQVGLVPVGFIDDDHHKHNMRIHGLPVLGERHDISQLVRSHGIEQVIIAMPTAPGKEIRRIVQICEQAGVAPRILPSLSELLEDKVTVSQLRNVEIDDLLRREPVQIDTGAVRELIRGKRVLVTGGGGSIGSELCRQILTCDPAELALLGHGENSIFQISNELRSQAHRQQTRPIAITSHIADLRLLHRVEAIFGDVRPDIVFHAAAHKHVPLMEMNPSEAIDNNVIGTQNLLDAALKYDVTRFVMISTDKAVNPTSIMGASKRVAEMLVHQAALKSRRPYVAVRFGNVLGSRGSVVLTFKQQIAAGGPVTVTHPEMKRYFMTIPEAVQLVLQAAVLGRGGEVFVLDMGEPVKIVDLARDLIELSGLKVGRDIDIIFTGTRPGEKLYEELFVASERYRRTQHQQLLIADNASYCVKSDLDARVGFLEMAARTDDRKAIVRGLKDLVPEYQPTPQFVPEANPREPSKHPIHAASTASMEFVAN
jgi:FlaA1/EpsC-like NDP-sugar epimerase